MMKKSEGEKKKTNIIINNNNNSCTPKGVAPKTEYQEYSTVLNRFAEKRFHNPQPIATTVNVQQGGTK